MLSVLHIYPPHNAMLAQYANMLTNDSMIKSEAIDDVNALTLRLKDPAQHPDLIHQHGCNHPGITKATALAYRKGIRIVLTPHGELEPWEMKNNMPARNSMLKNLVAHSYAVIARSSMEAEELSKQGWNSRIETIRNPLITRTTNAEELMVKHRHIYQRVMNSNILELMDEATQDALKTLIKAGITGDERWVRPIDTEAVNWHHLLLYAQLEGVKALVERGILAMGIQMREVEITHSFLPDSYTPPESVIGKSVIDIVRHIQKQTSKQQLALLSLAELDAALRREDVEDDLLMQQLKAEKIDGFFASLLTVLNEQTGLDEGYMPCEPTENSETKQIRKIIKKHLEI